MQRWPTNFACIKTHVQIARRYLLRLNVNIMQKSRQEVAEDANNQMRW